LIRLLSIFTMIHSLPRRLSALLPPPIRPPPRRIRSGIKR